MWKFSDPLPRKYLSDSFGVVKPTREHSRVPPTEVPAGRIVDRWKCTIASSEGGLESKHDY